MKQAIYRLVYALLTIPLLMVSVWCSIWRLFKIRHALREAEYIVVMPDGGFGHTITGPDVMRRLFHGRRLVFLIFERIHHNPHVALLWSDVLVLVLPFRWRARILGRIHEWLSTTAARKRFAAWLIWWLKRSTSATVLSLSELYRHTEERFPVGLSGYGFDNGRQDDRVKLILERLNTRFICGWHKGWTQLIRDVRVPELHLPHDVRVMIRAKIERFAVRSKTGKKDKLCNLYLRRKGEGISDKTSACRVGAPFEAYLPALRMLWDAGYLVLLTGDKVPEERYTKELDYQVVCAPWAGVDPGLFALFAGTDAHLWIGNMGGGNVPPIPNQVPMLVVDGFPYGVGVSNAWMHYKTVRDGEGRLIDYRYLFSKHAFECDFADWTICDNSPKEIADAVGALLQALREPQADGQTQSAFSILPDYVMEKHLNCRLSASWLGLFEAEATVTPSHLAMAVGRGVGACAR